MDVFLKAIKSTNVKNLEEFGEVHLVKQAEYAFYKVHVTQSNFEKWELASVLGVIRVTDSLEELFK